MKIEKLFKKKTNGLKYYDKLKIMIFVGDLIYSKILLFEEFDKELTEEEKNESLIFLRKIANRKIVILKNFSNNNSAAKIFDFNESPFEKIFFTDDETKREKINFIKSFSFNYSKKKYIMKLASYLILMFSIFCFDCFFLSHFKKLDYYHVIKSFDRDYAVFESKDPNGIASKQEGDEFLPVYYLHPNYFLAPEILMDQRTLMEVKDFKKEKIKYIHGRAPNFYDEIVISKKFADKNNITELDFNKEYGYFIENKKIILKLSGIYEFLNFEFLFDHNTQDYDITGMHLAKSVFLNYHYPDAEITPTKYLYSHDDKNFEKLLKSHNIFSDKNYTDVLKTGNEHLVEKYSDYNIEYSAENLFIAFFVIFFLFLVNIKVQKIIFNRNYDRIIFAYNYIADEKTINTVFILKNILSLLITVITAIIVMPFIYKVIEKASKGEMKILIMNISNVLSLAMFAIVFNLLPILYMLKNKDLSLLKK